MSWIEGLGLIVGIIGTSIAIYQTAIINESKKRKAELQFLLAGIANSALAKNLSWQNQIQLIISQDEKNIDYQKLEPYIRARDDMSELSTLASALEGVIDPSCSASLEIMDKANKTADINNELQKKAQQKL